MLHDWGSTLTGKRQQNSSHLHLFLFNMVFTQLEQAVRIASLPNAEVVKRFVVQARQTTDEADRKSVV